MKMNRKKSKKTAWPFSAKKKKGFLELLISSGGKKKKKKLPLKAGRGKSLGLSGVLRPVSKDGLLAAGITAAAAGIAALPFWLLAPAKAKEEDRKKFVGRYYAHRGLYEEDQSVPENSLAAFKRAVEWGYGIELDVQLSRDGFAVVFHDDDLQRACGDPRKVNDVPWQELRAMRLFGTKKGIPLFRDVLSLIGGKVPLIVELKSGPRNEELCRSVCAILRDYAGDACVESFDPRIVAWFRRNDPKRIRGQLAQPPQLYREDGMSAVRSAILGATLLNVMARPHFIAYRIGGKPAPVRLSESMGAMRFGWTSREEGDADGFDSVIFEYYRPERKL